MQNTLLADPRIGNLESELMDVYKSLRPDSCPHHDTPEEGMIRLGKLRQTSEEQEFKPSCFRAWLGEGKIAECGQILLQLEERYPDLTSDSEEGREEVRVACQQLGHSANDNGGLSGMMHLHDAVIVALGWSYKTSSMSGSDSWPGDVCFGLQAPHYIDHIWDGIGEWQKRRGWRYLMGGPCGPGRYEFSSPAKWPYGYEPNDCCTDAKIPRRLLELLTSQADEVAEAALHELERADVNDPFTLAAAAWIVGQRSMIAATPSLQPLKKHGSYVVRVFSIEALWKITGDRSEAVTSLVEILASKTCLGENIDAQDRALRLLRELRGEDDKTQDVLGLTQPKRTLREIIETWDLAVLKS